MTANRTIRRNVYGNIRGYIGNRLEVEFGSDAITAAYWKHTGIVDFDAGYGDCLNECRETAVKHLGWI